MSTRKRPFVTVAPNPKPVTDPALHAAAEASASRFLRAMADDSKNAEGGIDAGRVIHMLILMLRTIHHTCDTDARSVVEENIRTLLANLYAEPPFSDSDDEQ